MAAILSRGRWVELWINELCPSLHFVVYFVVWYQLILPITFRVTYDCTSIGETTLKNMGRSIILTHYSDIIMGAMASQITSLMIVYSTVYSGADQRKHQSSTSLAFVQGIHQWPVNSSHKGPVRRKMFPFDDIIMYGFPAIIMRHFTEIIDNGQK